jgi:hypothetical protein
MIGRNLCRAVLVLALASTGVAPGIAGEAAPTDANLVTALDLSDSIMRHEQWLQFSGLAGAIESEAFLRTIAQGRRGRIGLLVFTWSSGGASEMIVPWTLISSKEEARQVAALLRVAGARDRLGAARSGGGLGKALSGAERRTDLSSAIELATTFAMATPFDGARKVINICANGSDNVDEGPDAVRDGAITAGIVLNGLVIGRRKGLATYFRDHVQGGAGSFVLEVMAYGTMTDAMLEKLLRDLIALRRATPPSSRRFSRRRAVRSTRGSQRARCVRTRSQAPPSGRARDPSIWPMSVGNGNTMVEARSLAMVMSVPR